AVCCIIVVVSVSTNSVTLILAFFFASIVFICCFLFFFFFFFFNDTATTEIYTLSLHDALPILLKLLAPSTFRCRRCKALLWWLAVNQKLPGRTMIRDETRTRRAFRRADH